MKLEILDNKIRIKDTSNTWIFKITEILSNKPLEWKECIDKKHFYTIIKNEMENLTKAKATYENNHILEDYEKSILKVASACVLALMNI